jgi:hypothetical protein
LSVRDFSDSLSDPDSLLSSVFQQIASLRND